MHGHFESLDSSVRAANWYSHRADYPINRVSKPESRISGGYEAHGADWPKIIAEWQARIKEQASNEGEFKPKTEFGRKLWALRQRYVSEGGQLYTSEEIALEISQHRDRER